MITRYRVALNGVQLDSLSPDIIIADIAYTAPTVQRVASALAMRHGLYEQGKTYGTSSVTVSFEIHEPRVHLRQEICKKVQGWAICGGVMTTNDRLGQRLRVACASLPAIDSALRWTNKLYMTFTAHEKPFWEDVMLTAVGGVTPDASRTLYIAGTAEDAPVNVKVQNTGTEAVDSLTVRAGDTFMEFTGLALAADGVLEIGHDDRGMLYIRADGESRMDRRTAESSDDLMISQNVKSTLAVVCDGSVSAAFTARGRYV